MDVLYSWLRSLADGPADAGEAARLLIRQGINVERVRWLGEGLAGVVAAEVLTSEPLGERLTRVRVRAGGATGTIVTGAPVAPGEVRAWAPPGATLPDGRTMAVQTFHGTPSEGMLLSARELGIGPEEDRLLDLEGLAPGADVKAALELPDAVLEIDLTPNLAGFCQSAQGLARELSAAMGRVAGTPQTVWPTPEGPEVSVALQPGGIVRQYLGGVVRAEGPLVTPLWMKRRLWASGMRSLGAFVDVTNYILLESGQPLHAFDLDRLVPPLGVRLARADEMLVTLDHVPRALTPQDIVIADREGPVALAGVMGGLRTEVTGDTRAVYLEAAVFDPLTVRQTARRHGILSEAAQRFEKGVDEEGVGAALRRAIDLLRGMGAREGRVVTVEVPERPTVRRLTVRPARVRDLLGVEVDDAFIATALRRLGLRAEAGQGVLRIDVPVRRRDLEGEADIAEEVGRLLGFDRIPETPLPPRQPGRRLEEDVFSDDLRRALQGLGLVEHWGTSLVSERDAATFGPSSLALVNPLSQEGAFLRPSLVPSLLGAIRHNVSRQSADVRLFEIGRTYHPSEGWPEEEDRVALALTGSWAGNWATPAREIGFYDLKGILEAAMGTLHIKAALGVAREPRPYLHPGRQGEITAGAGRIGWLGELLPALAQEAGGGRIFVAELAIKGLRSASERPAYRPFSRYPAVERDLAVVFPEEVRYDEVVNHLWARRSPHLQRALLFDVYRGRPVPEGQKSLAIRLVFQADDRTLSDDEVDRLVDGIRESLAELGGRVRA